MSVADLINAAQVDKGQVLLDLAVWEKVVGVLAAHEQQFSVEVAPNDDGYHVDDLVVNGGPNDELIIVGTDITVSLILERLAAGDTAKQILQAYPQLTPDAIQAALYVQEDLDYIRQVKEDDDELIPWEQAMAEVGLNVPD